MGMLSWISNRFRKPEHACPNCGHSKIHYNLGHPCTGKNCDCGSHMSSVKKVDSKVLAASLCPVGQDSTLYTKWMMTRVPIADMEHLRRYAEDNELLVLDVEKRFDWPEFRDEEIRMAAAIDDYDPPHAVEWPVDFEARLEAARD